MGQRGDGSPDIVRVKRQFVGSTVVAMKKITELPRCEDWKTNADHVRRCVKQILNICAEAGMIPTINLMSMALGVSKQTEYNARTGVVACSAEVMEILKEYASICENVTLQATLDGTANNIGGIFAMKALYGYRDEPKEIVVTHNYNGLLGERKNPEEIAQRYAEAVVLDVEPSELRYVEQQEESDDSV